MRTAEQLAAWATYESDVGEPFFLVRTVAAAFEVRVRSQQGLGKAGRLELYRGRVTIIVDGGRARRRFSAAHELGHYLLAAVEEVPVAQQTKERRYEQYCNAFASHLLLPRAWVRGQINGPSTGLTGAIDVAARSDCSLMAVVGALHSGGGWDRPLVRWCKSGSDWNVVNVIAAKHRHAVVESLPSAVPVLDRAQSRPSMRTVELRVHNCYTSLDMEIVRFGNVAYGLAASDLRAFERHRIATSRPATMVR
jgi:IrrE N-terminal-like domain